MKPTSSAGRIDAIDFWRGVALLTIFIDHGPLNVFQYVTQKNFGFSDAAELFVFLSGASVALAYGSRFFRGETAAAVKAVLRRALTLYWVQVLISLVIIAIFAAAAMWWDNDDFVEDNDRDAVVSSPLSGIPAVLTLLHQFENVNILPLYVVLMLLTPVLLLLARRDDRLMLLGSGLLYLAGRVFDLNLPTWPLDGGWYFHPFTWQFIFALGLFVGRRLRTGGIGYDRRLFALCLAIVGTSCFVVTDGFFLWPDLASKTQPLLDLGKSELGLGRLVHFLALAYVVGHSGATDLLRRTAAFSPLALIGRYSLPVFATGCVLVAISEVIVSSRPEDYAHPLLLGAVIAVGGSFLHYALARFIAASRSGELWPILVPVRVLRPAFAVARLSFARQRERA